jgi:hypothetical protein
MLCFRSTRVLHFACLVSLLAGGCTGLPGERWEVRAKQGLSRASLNLQASRQESTLYVNLWLDPAPNEEAHVTDLYLVPAGRSSEAPGGEAEGEGRLRPDSVGPTHRSRGPIGVGFVYSNGDTERYVSRYTGGGSSWGGGAPGPEELQAKWTLAGPWAEARDLELVVHVASSPYSAGGGYAQEARYLLTAPVVKEKPRQSP